MAAYTCGRLNDSTAQSLLIAAAQSPMVELQVSAIGALSKLASCKEVLDQLKAALQSEETLVVEAAADALAELDFTIAADMGAADMDTHPALGNALARVAAEKGLLVFPQFYVDRKGITTGWKKPTTPDRQPPGSTSQQLADAINNQALNKAQGDYQWRKTFESAVVRIKSLANGKKPDCFISYAWGKPAHEGWVKQLATDLRSAGIDALLDLWNSQPGSNLDEFIEKTHECSFVLVVGTPLLLQKYQSESTDPVVAAELRLINLRVREKNAFGPSVIPLLLDGDAKTAFTPQLRPLVSMDFRQPDEYWSKLITLIWLMHGLPMDHPLLSQFQQALKPY